MAGGCSAAPIDPSELVADECVEALGELRYDVPVMPITPK